MIRRETLCARVLVIVLGDTRLKNPRDCVKDGDGREFSCGDFEGYIR
jgi:hypothetical protein